MKLEEQLSQFLDGETNAEQSAHLIKQMRDSQARKTWERYHLIGDAMRKELPASLSSSLAERVRLSLENEPTLFAPNALKPIEESSNNVAPIVAQAQPVTAKSSARFAWGAGLAASVALVGLLGLQMNTPSETVLASAPMEMQSAPMVVTASPVTAVPQVVMVAGIDRPVVKPAPAVILAEQNPVPNGSWNRLDVEQLQFSPYLSPTNEFSVAPGAVAPSAPMAHVASFGQNRAQ
ncbi:MAG: sigma-E factor negative regulatory protein [Gammaproteobacteria bacterium]|nr:sigma-E factor negative regulatory protein [Gammaproteobacteria bacterium]